MVTQAEADKTMATEEKRLLENSNVAYIAVVERTTEGPSGDDFVIEVGLKSDEVGVEEQRVESESLSDFVRFKPEPVPDILPIPVDVSMESVLDLRDQGYVDVIKVISGSTQFESISETLNPVRGGAACSNFRTSSRVGTIGAAFSTPKKDYLLSAWHVFYGPSGKNGDAIEHPPGDTRLGGAGYVAHNSVSLLSDCCDAAIAELSKPLGVLVHKGIIFLGEISGVSQATLNSMLKKFGAVTNLTFGLVRSINATVRIDVRGAEPYIFHDQLLLTKMSMKGDSGSALLDSQSNMLIGLIFAGTGTTATFATKVENIFRVESGTAYVRVNSEPEVPVEF